MLKESSPQSVIGDTNCLYHSISVVGNYGTQEEHQYVRLLTPLELIGNPAAYDVTSQPHEESAQPYDRSLVIASYRQQCLMCQGLELMARSIHVVKSCSPCTPRGYTVLFATHDVVKTGANR